MARFPTLLLRLFASGFVLATAFSLQAPLKNVHAESGRGLTVARNKAMPSAVPVPVKNE
jgi:hypothetical protein